MSCFSEEVPFLSVIIPSYNRFSYLQELVDSIHNQADYPFELLIHDDNSRDGAKGLLPNIDNKVSATIYSHGFNFGLAESINRLVRLASSNYILMLNADLKIEQPIFEDIINVLQNLYVGYLTFMTTYGEIPKAINSNGTNFMLTRGLGAGCAMAFRKDVWTQVDGWNNKTVATGNADVSFMIRVVRHGYFPTTLVKKTPDPLIINMSMLSQKGQDSTIGRVTFDCSLPRLFNYQPYMKQSQKRYDDAANAMQITYKEPEGEVNLHFWHTFLNELIKEDYTVDWELAQKHGHIRWKDQVKLLEPNEYRNIHRAPTAPEYLSLKLSETPLEFVERTMKNYYSAQNADELAWLVDKVKKLNPTAILEIGIESGGTLKIWEQLLKQEKNSILIGIDLSPNMQWDITQSKVSVTVLKGDAHTPEVIHEVIEIIKDRKFDFIFIDSTHTPKAVRLETETYKNFLKPCGVIGYHDINDIKEYLDTLEPNRIEKYHKEPPYAPFGAQGTIGVAIYYAT
jgi:glycosyltransferase involved in cell wall biosynthesis